MTGKPKVAFFDFTCCEGCQLTVVDSLQTHLGLLDAVEIVQFREAMSEKGEDYQIAFIEGSASRPADEDRLRRIREQADIVVALGACAHLGGVNAIRNSQDLADVRAYVYGDKAEWFDTYPARPIDSVIKVDVVIPGCPIDRDEFASIVKMLLQGRLPRLPETPLCVECKLRENVCVYRLGKTCLGPIIRAGCGAICPSYGDGCEGCRGLLSEPNIDSLKMVMAEHGMALEAIQAKLGMFLTGQTSALKIEGN
jgi:coenzyme F420-reducing hydrogenase gamma subunit